MPDRLRGSWMLGSVSRTSWIRSAETAARGTMMNMRMAIMTANRICIRYGRKAVRLPIGMPPLSTRQAPNHMTATVDRLKISHHHRDRHREEPVDPQAGVEQVLVGDVEALLLVLGAHEGPDDAHAGQGLAHDLVDPVELDLHRPEERDRPGA